MNSNQIHNHEEAGWIVGWSQYGLAEGPSVWVAAARNTADTNIDHTHSCSGYTQNQSDTHSNYKHSHSYSGNTGGSNGENSSVTHNHTITVNNTGNNESRPYNITLKLWKRMA